MFEITEEKELRLLDSLELPSWKIHDGKSVVFSKNGVLLGRSAGNGNELYSIHIIDGLLTAENSLDVKASVRDILSVNDFILLATNASAKEFQVLEEKEKGFKEIWSYDFAYDAQSIVCMGRKIIVVTDYLMYVIEPI
jgi:hypothetical protein